MIFDFLDFENLLWCLMYIKNIGKQYVYDAMCLDIFTVLTFWISVILGNLLWPFTVFGNDFEKF